MYKVFLVDDEPIVLEGIRSKIEWESLGFTFAGEATDGEIALSMIQEIKPDVLITDIKMPFMDGLQLSASIKKIQPWIKIIILSGHDEFDYAKKAISIGIEDYLLKPFTSEDIITSLRKVSQEIDKERKQLSDISKMKEELKSQEKLLQKEFLNNLVHGSTDINTVMAKDSELGLDLISRYYRILISKIQCEDNDSEIQQEACSLINSYSTSWEQTNSFFHHQNRFVCICKGTSKEEVEDNTYRIAESIEHIVSQKEKCSVTTAIGKTVQHLSAIPDSYEDAKRILDIAITDNQNRILTSDDIQINGGGLLELKENDPMVSKLKYATTSDIKSIIDESLALIKSNPGQFQFFASYVLVDLIFAVSKLIENLGGDIKQLKPEILQRTYVDSASMNEEKFVSSMEDILNFALNYRNSTITGKYGDIILKAKKYIEENYSDPNTTLTTVAEVVCLSPNHFSTIFSQQCKTTFIEYLTNVRIENAKRLLKETDKKGYDIAYDCGFSDPHYFSYIFKKNTGLTPREYKSEL